MLRWLASAAALVAAFALVAVAAAANGHANYHAVCPAAAGDARCNAFVVDDASGKPQASPTPPPAAYGPAQFHTAYNLPTAGKTAQTIGIVDAYDNPNVERDLATYDSTFGLPACTTANGCFRKVDQNGGTRFGRTDAGWALETALDVETAHEICQSCKILLVEARDASIANLGAAVNEAVALGATVVSNSYGDVEYAGEAADQSAYYTHPGVALVASSGDSGYGVQFPAAASTVTAVGGTTLTLGAGNAYAGESAWAGAGSGCSAYIAKPAWQTDAGCAGRTVADVSADADPNTGAAIYSSVRYQGQAGWFQVGGTSLAAPIVAGVYALAGNAGSIADGSWPYAHASSLRDVTGGSNGACGSYLCTGVAGYDGPTGLGSPNGTRGF